MPLSAALPVNVPVGAVMMYAGKAENTWLESQGWMICDGRALSMTDDNYASLYKTIQNAFGATADKFYIPDCRGMFVRGVDMGRHQDPNSSQRTPQQPNGNSGDAVGSVQKDEFRAHTHQLRKWYRSFQGQDANDKPYDDQGQDWGNTEASGGSETRPVNVYLYYIIKFRA